MVDERTARNAAVGLVGLNNKFKKNETSALKKSQNLSFVTFNLQRQQKIISMWAILATSNTPGSFYCSEVFGVEIYLREKYFNLQL